MEITSLGLEGILQFLPLIMMSVFALWKENSVLLMITAGIAIMTGLYSPDIVSGAYETTPLGISVGLGLIAYALLCCGWALELMFWEKE